jgi:hypothetical protein
VDFFSLARVLDGIKNAKQYTTFQLQCNNFRQFSPQRAPASDILQIPLNYWSKIKTEKQNPQQDKIRKFQEKCYVQTFICLLAFRAK